jgi:hypothetical protein
MLYIKVNRNHELELTNGIRFNLGGRPESFQNFLIESHRMTPTPIIFNRQSVSAKGR